MRSYAAEILSFEVLAKLSEINVSQLYDKTVQILRSWEGYSVLEPLFENYEGMDIFLAGGAMRDIISRNGNQPKDFDLFVSGESVEDFFDDLQRAGTLTKGPFGSHRWIFKDAKSDSKIQYADVIDIRRFYNGLWCCEDIVDVLNQFDFTANAIALDLRSPLLLDPQNGLRDIKKRILRAVRFDYPEEPISPSCSLSRLSVLWHRLRYYANKTGFTIESVTFQWLQKNAHYQQDGELFHKTFNLPFYD